MSDYNKLTLNELHNELNRLKKYYYLFSLSSL